MDPLRVQLIKAEYFCSIDMPKDYKAVRPQSSPSSISIDEAVDRIGTGPFQHRLLFATGVCFMADSMEIMLLSFLSLWIKRNWDLGEDTDIKVASITSVMFFGAMIGTSILGPLGDKYGRKPAMSISAFIISFFGILTAFCDSIIPLILVRFVVGFGIGGLTVPFDILAELIPNENRGRYLMLIEYFWTAGSMLVPVLAYLTLEMSWKLFVVLCAMPCVLSLVMTYSFVPESPRWLVCQGRDNEAWTILRSAARMNGHDPYTLFPEGSIICHNEEEDSSAICDLFKPKWRRITFLLFSTWIGFAFSYYGVIMTVTRIFGEKEADDGFDYGAIFISSSAELIGTAIVIAVVDKIGRIPTQVASYSVGGVFVFLLCYFANTLSRPPLIAFAFVARVAEMSGSCVTWISTAELLSTEIRTSGHSATNAVARLGGFTMPYVLSGDIPLEHIGVIMLFIHFSTAMASYHLPETKGLDLGQMPLQAQDREFHYRGDIALGFTDELEMI